MTILRTLACLMAAVVAAASPPVLAGETPAPAASAPAVLTKAARQEADRQRLIAKLRAEAPKTTDKPRGTVVDLPIFNRYSRP